MLSHGWAVATHFPAKPKDMAMWRAASQAEARNTLLHLVTCLLADAQSRMTLAVGGVMSCLTTARKVLTVLLLASAADRFCGSFGACSWQQGRQLCGRPAVPRAGGKPGMGSI